jgi:outer membrane protein assembly factor BamB
VALDGKTGKKIWDKPRAGLKSSWSTPVLATVASKPQLILSGDPFAMGHDPATGEAIWKFNWTEDASVEVAPSPAFANGIAYFTTNRAALVAVKPGEEKPLWRYDEDQPDIPSPVATEKFVILAGGSPVVTCLDAVKGTKLWTHDFDDGFEASPVVAGDLVYFLDKKGVMFVLKLSEKYEQVARNELGEDSSCTPAFLPGRLYLRSKTSLYCISKD